MDYPRPYQDTTPEALEVWLDLLRKMPAEEKIPRMFGLTRFARKMSESGVRSQFPQASEREVFLRVAARRLSREQMMQVYGWDPKEHG
jgi:hypothetical protein